MSWESLDIIYVMCASKKKPKLGAVRGKQENNDSPFAVGNDII